MALALIFSVPALAQRPVSKMHRLECVSIEHVASFTIAQDQFKEFTGDEGGTAMRLKGVGRFTLKTKSGQTLIDKDLRAKAADAIDLVLFRDSKLSLVRLESNLGEVMIGYHPLLKSSGIGFFSNKLNVDDKAQCKSVVSETR